MRERGKTASMNDFQPDLIFSVVRFNGFPTFVCAQWLHSLFQYTLYTRTLALKNSQGLQNGKVFHCSWPSW